jgi:tRNA(Ile)-lysidine synthase
LNLSQKTTEYISAHSMLPDVGALLLICVSGGVDSMVCLDLLAGIFSKNSRISSAVLHYNHGLRGEEADGDCELVRVAAKQYGLPFFTEKGDVAAIAAAQKVSIETAARNARYAFFQSAADKLCADHGLPASAARIATAHNARDNLETMLMNLARGAGGAGLSGIPPVNGRVIRPILCLDRPEIEQYARDFGIPFREDSSNSSDDYTRNKIRHSIIPVLTELNPNAAAAALETSAGLRRDEEYFSGLAQEFTAQFSDGGSTDAAAMLALPESVFARVCREISPEKLTRADIARIRSGAGKSAGSSRENLSNGQTAVFEYGRLRFCRTESPGADTRWEYGLAPGEETVISEAGLIATVSECEFVGIYKKIHKTFTEFLFPKSALCGKINIRGRLPGDKIRPFGKSGTKSLKKLLSDEKAPRESRDKIAVLADGAGVLAVHGYTLDNRVLREQNAKAAQAVCVTLRPLE